MYEAYCTKCNKKLAELGRKPSYDLSYSAICECGKKVVGNILTNAEKDEIVAYLNCICGYNEAKVIGYIVSIKCKKCKTISRF